MMTMIEFKSPKLKSSIYRADLDPMKLHEYEMNLIKMNKNGHSNNVTHIMKCLVDEMRAKLKLQNIYCALQLFFSLSWMRERVGDGVRFAWFLGEKM